MVVGRAVSSESTTVIFGCFSSSCEASSGELARGVLSLLEWQMDKEPGSRPADLLIG